MRDLYNHLRVTKAANVSAVKITRLTITVKEMKRRQNVVCLIRILSEQNTYVCRPSSFVFMFDIK